MGIGDTCEYDRMEKKTDGDRLIQLFWKDGLLRGANFVGTYTEAGVIKNALLKGLMVDKVGYDASLPVIQNLLIRKMLMEVEKA